MSEVVRRRKLDEIKQPVETKESSMEQARRYPDTPDELFEIEKSYEQAEEDLVKFVEKQIDLMKNNLLFSGEEIPSFYSLNKSLMDYEANLLGLIVLHQECRIEQQIAQERYDNFYAEKFVEIKQEQTNLGKSAQFTAARDIELCVRKRYMRDLARLKADIIKTENKYNFLNYLIDGWKNYQYVLGTLSRNAQAEASASGISSKTPKEFGDES
jgi:hypothetical protein